MKRILIVSLAMLLSCMMVQAQSYTCTIKNIIQPANNIIEFDVFVSSISSDTIYFQSFQGGINFNYAGIANGGNITGAFVPGSNTLAAPQNAPNWNINAITQQIRLIAAIQTSKSLAAIIPNAPGSLKIGTFRMTNTVPFATCSHADFEWSFITGSNITRTAISAWINSATTGVSITSTTHPAATFANGGGPQHFVESNPSINGILPPTNFNVSACLSYTWYGNTYTSSGIYAHTLTTAQGCDSVLLLNLIVDTPTTNITNQAACDTYTWPVDGQTYTNSGQYTFVTIQPGGCSNTEILNLTVNYASTSTDVISDCNAYMWPANGQVYYNSGIYTHFSTNSTGCPHTSTLILTLGQSNSFNYTIYNCSPIVWNGQPLTASGNYIYTTNNASGCDSTTFLNFILLPLITDTQTVYNCGPYTVAGNTFSTSGTHFYQTINSFGCTVNHVLFLTVGINSYTNLNVSSCGNYYYNNVVYTNSGIYTSIMPNTIGCDSIITLNLIVSQPITLSQYITTCDSYTISGNTYTSSGIYTILDTTVSGCDSTIILNLTIKKSSSSYTSQTAINNYTWPVNNVTYTSTGLYVNTGTNSAGCSQNDTLNLTINFPSGVQNITNVNSITLYPNPANHLATLAWEANSQNNLIIKMLDLSGRVVKEINYKSSIGKNALPLDLSGFADGIYALEINTKDGDNWYHGKLVKRSE